MQHIQNMSVIAKKKKRKSARKLKRGAEKITRGSFFV